MSDDNKEILKQLFEKIQEVETLREQLGETEKVRDFWRDEAQEMAAWLIEWEDDPDRRQSAQAILEKEDTSHEHARTSPNRSAGSDIRPPTQLE